MKTFSIFCLLCTSSFFAPAQTSTSSAVSKQEVIAAYQKLYAWFVNTPGYAFKLKYASYNDHQSKALIESSEGYYKRTPSGCVTEALGIKTIQNNSLRTVIDTAEQTVTLMDAGSLSPAMATAEELEAMLSNTRSLKKTKLAGSIRYRIDFNKNTAYEAYEFTVSDKGLLEMMTYYYSEQVQRADKHEDPKAEDIRVTPRLEILFSDYQVPAKYSAAELSTPGIAANERGKTHLTGAYKSFRLLDYRLQAKK